MTINKELLKNKAAEQGIPLTEEGLDRFDRYAELLISWNQKFNLTAITDPDEIVIKHFVDSLMLFKYVSMPNGASLLDVGTGAGLPGLALLIAKPTLRVTLLDATQKKLTFLKEVSDELGLHPKLMHGRAEELGKDSAYREHFQFVTARAVSKMQTLSELCMPLVQIHGNFIAMKGPDVEEETKAAKNGIHILGGAPANIVTYPLEQEGERSLVIIEKTHATPKQYPRLMGKIKTAPLS